MKKSLLLVDAKRSFLESLRCIVDMCHKASEIKIEKIFEVLAGNGFAALLVLFSFPFCLPIQIPGFSTPFGLILGFLGLRIAFGRHLWWPKWILEKNITANSLEKIIKKIIAVVQVIQKVIKPRLLGLVTSRMLLRLHGIVVFFLAIFLSLPLPIPFTNMLAALPILCFGLGLLEDDGLFILIAYLLTFFCLSLFIIILFFGSKFL